MIHTSERIITLAPNEIFVFGSNLAGRHGAGAAKWAAEHFGAVQGVGVGPTGDCYALPTKDKLLNPLPLREIFHLSVCGFLWWAHEHSDLVFLVTPVGCGLAGYTPEDIAPMFSFVQRMLSFLNLSQNYYDKKQ